MSKITPTCAGRIFGLKRLRRNNASGSLFGPYTSYHGYPLPGLDPEGQDIPGRWTERIKPKFADSGWHFYSALKLSSEIRQDPRPSDYSWFLVEGEGPIVQGKMTTQTIAAASRLRFIREVKPGANGELLTIRQYVNEAKRDGLI